MNQSEFDNLLQAATRAGLDRRRVGQAGALAGREPRRAGRVGGARPAAGRAARRARRDQFRRPRAGRDPPRRGGPAGAWPSVVAEAPRAAVSAHSNRGRGNARHGDSAVLATNRTSTRAAPRWLRPSRPSPSSPPVFWLTSRPSRRSRRPTRSTRNFGPP